MATERRLHRMCIDSLAASETKTATHRHLARFGRRIAPRRAKSNQGFTYLKAESVLDGDDFRCPRPDQAQPHLRLLSQQLRELLQPGRSFRRDSKETRDFSAGDAAGAKARVIADGKAGWEGHLLSGSACGTRTLLTG